MASCGGSYIFTTGVMIAMSVLYSGGSWGGQGTGAPWTEWDNNKWILLNKG